MFSSWPVAKQRSSKPPLWLLSLEGRALWERAARPLLQPLLGAAKKGDGHTVLVLPGLLASDGSTAVLRRYLSRLGYCVSGWDLGRNFGPKDGVIEQIAERLASLRQASGRRVSLVGWSLGGIYARELARVAPKAVRCVVTLGSPLYGHPLRTTNTWTVYRAVSGRSSIRPGDRGDCPPPVPTTSILSLSDGIVGWRASIEQVSDSTENIVVRGASHLGLPYHPAVLHAIADRLAQAENQWVPFVPTGLARAFYGAVAAPGIAGSQEYA